MRTRAEFLRTDRARFMRRISGNGCWLGRAAITSTGDVLPCVMQRDHPAGNVRTEPLAQIVRRGLKRYWDLSLDHIEVCRDCEYRYACQDCRPVAYGPTGSLTARSLYCCYDPYRGEWLQDNAGTGEAPPA
jgi:radical SAM protein with 4Fe4S-binding SPASM domain